MFEQLAGYLAQYLVLSEREFLHFASFLKRRHVTRHKGLIDPGQPAAFDVFVETGCLRIYSITTEGSDRVLDFGTENSWWCHSSLAGLYLLPTVGIDALEPTDVLLIDKRSKEQLCGDLPNFERLFRFLAQSTLAALQQRLVLSLQNTAEARYQEFTRLYPHLEGRIPHYHVASFLGICPEFFSKLRKRPPKVRSS